MSQSENIKKNLAIIPNLVGDKAKAFDIDEVQPLMGRFSPNISFSEIVRRLERPYFDITEDEYRMITKKTKSGINGKPTDYVLFRGRVCTFGNEGCKQGYAIMPLEREYANDIKKKSYDYLSSSGTENEKILLVLSRSGS